MKAKSINEAWNMADEIFNTDYMKKEGAENMKYSNIAALVIETAENTKTKQAEYIRKPEYYSLRQYSTATRWNQFQAGTITREQAEAYATARMIKQTDKRTAAAIERLETYENAPTLKSVTISVEWKRSRTWGANPTATATYYNGRYGQTTGTASGCGYDKESAAVADALNKIPSAMKALCECKENAIKAGKQARAEWNDSNADVIAYGAGYGAIPYFEGGVGMSSTRKVLEAAGYKCTHETHGKYYDYYCFELAEAPESVTA